MSSYSGANVRPIVPARADTIGHSLGARDSVCLALTSAVRMESDDHASAISTRAQLAIGARDALGRFGRAREYLTAAGRRELARRVRGQNGHDGRDAELGELIRVL